MVLAEARIIQVCTVFFCLGGLFTKLLIFLARLSRHVSDRKLYSCGQNFGQISTKKLKARLSLHTFR